MRLPQQAAGCIRNSTVCEVRYTPSTNPAWKATLIKAAGRIIAGALAGYLGRE